MNISTITNNSCCRVCFWREISRYVYVMMMMGKRFFVTFSVLVSVSVVFINVNIVTDKCY
jgi:hypothetical protein